MQTLGIPVKQPALEKGTTPGVNKTNSHEVDIEVRFSDLDAYGHVNNATFFTYLETARTKLFLKDFVEFARSGLLFLVVKAECEYKRPIDLTDRVVVTLRVVRFGNSSFDIDYRLHDGNGATYAEAKTVMVCYDQTQKKTVPVPAGLTAALG